MVGHSSVPAWRIPWQGAWWAIVHRVTKRANPWFCAFLDTGRWMDRNLNPRMCKTQHKAWAAEMRWHRGDCDTGDMIFTSVKVIFCT